MGGRAGDAGSCAQVSGDTAEVQGGQHDRQAEWEVGDHDPPEVGAEEEFCGVEFLVSRVLGKHSGAR